MMWFEKILVSFLAAICEGAGVDSETLARHRAAEAREPADGNAQTIYRFK